MVCQYLDAFIDSVFFHFATFKMQSGGHLQLYQGFFLIQDGIPPSTNQYWFLARSRDGAQKTSSFISFIKC